MYITIHLLVFIALIVFAIIGLLGIILLVSVLILSKQMENRQLYAFRLGEEENDR